MQHQIEIDSNFMKIALPVLAEFGFVDTKTLIKEQLILMLASRVSHYDAEVKLLEEKYGGSYEDLMQQKQGQEENFDLEDSMNDWRFAIEAARRYQKKLQEIESA